MPVSLPFEQVDVFSEQPFKGNAVAVVIGADRLSRCSSSPPGPS